MTKIWNSYIEECPSYEPADVQAALGALLESSGSLDWVQPGMKIGIKLNLCAAKSPDTAAVTHPALASELTRLLVARGAKVVLGDSCGGPYNAKFLQRVYDATQMGICEEVGGKLNDNFNTSTVEFEAGVTLKTYACTEWLLECDEVINFCKLKSHGMMGITAAVKNLYGIIPGTIKSEYHYLHKDPGAFANMLVDLNESLRPRLVIVDAIDIMEGNGPTMGEPRHMGLLMASTSPYELDRIGASLLGVNESEIPYMVAAINRGLIEETASASSELDELVAQYGLSDFKRSGATSSWFIVTDEDKLLQKIAKKGMYYLLRSKPYVYDGCTGCGHCKQSCPADAIEIKKGVAVIKRSKCVRCYCCQEFCPTGAMKVKRSLAAKLMVKN